MHRAAKILFVAVFFGGQFALVTASYVRGDRLGGYQMFAETTFFTARLHRVTRDGRRELTRSGTWTVRDAAGVPRAFDWRRMIDEFKLDRLDRRERAKIGIAPTLKFFQLALDHVVDRIPDDPETVRLELDIEWETASGKRDHTTLKSHDRVLPP